MKSIAWTVAMAATITTGICWGQSAVARPASGCSADALPILQSLWAEVRNLRKELLEDRRDIQQAKLQELQKQLGAIQEQQRAIDQEQSSRTSELAEIEVQLQRPNLEKNEREDLENQKAQLLSMPPEPSSAVQNGLSQRETRVRDLLANQEQHLGVLDQLIRQLTADSR